MSRGDLKEHNQQQIDYFEKSHKRNMQPAEGTHYVNRQIRELLEFAKITPDERILDVGCGIGRYTLPLASLGYNVEGLDLTPGLLEQLRQHAAGRFDIPLYCADILDPPSQLLERFDALVGFFTLHHLHDITASYRSMTRLVKPGGRIIFLEPNAFNLLYYLQIALTPTMTWQGDRGIVYMREGYVFRAMAEAGLRNLSRHNFGFFPPFVVNRPVGAKLEHLLERNPLWRPILPFQLFMGVKPARD